MASDRPIFGYGSEPKPRRGRPLIVRPADATEEWSDAILPHEEGVGNLTEGETTRRPLLALAAVIFGAVLILTLRLASLQLVNGRRNLNLANGNRIRQKVTRAPRGVIYDRSGGMLARNAANFDLTVVPALLPRTAKDRSELYVRVASLVGLPKDQIAAGPEAALSSALHGQANALQPVLVATNIERDKALLLDQGGVDLPGFSLDVNPVREYLDNGLLASFLGYTGRVSPSDLATDPSYSPTDYIGKLGLEKSYESVLKGSNGSEQTEVDASGRPIKLLASKAPIAGANIVLTIDRGLEEKLAQSLQNQLAKSGATKASAIALDPRNGEVLAAVSLPTYDNNLFSRGISNADYQKLINDKAQPLFNKVIGGAYPSGSIIKPIVAAAGLEEKVINPGTTIEDKGSLEITNQYNKDVKYTFYGWEHSGLGVMNVYRAIAMSSDIFFYTLAGGYEKFVGLGITKLVNYYHKFGLGARTGVDLPDETSGRVPTPDWKQRVLKESWYTGDTYNVSVGQGDILVSPIQMATAISAIANGGTLYRPHFVKQVVDDQGNVLRQVSPEVVRKDLISPANLAVVREGMRQTVTSGTACCFIEQQVPVHVAGKTGTAETDPGGNRKPDAWFEAFAPYENPQIVIVALVENSGEGAEYAAPAVRETLQYYFTR